MGPNSSTCLLRLFSVSRQDRQRCGSHQYQDSDTVILPSVKLTTPCLTANHQDAVLIPFESTMIT